MQHPALKGPDGEARFHAVLEAADLVLHRLGHRGDHVPLMTSFTYPSTPLCIYYTHV